MKCIKAIRASKDVELGTIKRVDNKTANNMVGLSWVYVPKSEWKVITRKSKPNEEVTKQVETMSGPSQDQVEKKPYKKGQKPEKKSKKQ